MYEDLQGGTNSGIFGHYLHSTVKAVYYCTYCMAGFINFLHIIHRSHVGSVEKMLTSPCCIQAGILAPPNNMRNSTQKTALLMMTVCH
jgi:hypothetical protein